MDSAWQTGTADRCLLIDLMVGKMWALRAGVLWVGVDWWSWQMDVGSGEGKSRGIPRVSAQEADWWMMPVTQMGEVKEERVEEDHLCLICHWLEVLLDIL